MTKQEWEDFKYWCSRHDGIVIAYGVWAICGAWIAPCILLSAGELFWGLLVLVAAYGLPAILLGLNATILAIRCRTNRRLRFERRMKNIKMREERIAALERSCQ